MNYAETVGFKTAQRMIGKLAATNAYYMINHRPEGATTFVHKLSDKYNSRSTNYANNYNNAPFIINRNRADIVARGYSQLCKAIIYLDMSHPAIAELINAHNEVEEARIAVELGKKKIADEITAEIESLRPLVDDFFKTEVNAIYEAGLVGDLKSDACRTSLLSFLSRINYGKINSDFWKVFRGINPHNLTK